MAQIPIDWPTIQESDEWSDDVALLTPIVAASFGVDQVITPDSPYVLMIVNLLATIRYFSRHINDTHDIDTTPFLNYIQDEVGFGLPLTSEIPIVEWLRENKSWYGHRGTLKLFNFIADLVGSPLEIDYPAYKIARWDDGTTLPDGSITDHGGPVRFSDSKLGILHDGYKWAQFVYVVEVLQAQNVINITDLINLLDNVHPAGVKRYIDFQFKSVLVESQPELLGWGEDIIESFYLPSYPTLDNGLYWDNRNSLIDMHNGHSYIILGEAPSAAILENFLALYRQLPYDTLTNLYIGTETSAGYGRAIDNHDGTYTLVYGDTDADVYLNTTTNMGMSGYTYGNTKNLTYQQAQNIAWNLDGKNNLQNFMPQLLASQITAT